ncbi:MAG: hypothetical protein R3D57_19070 [Hyphomicrobiaceae bacterium]
MGLSRAIGNFGAVLIVFAAAGAMAGCSQAPGFPKLPIGDIIGQKTLTPAEQREEIKDLSTAQAENVAQASSPEGAPKYIPASVNTDQ